MGSQHALPSAKPLLGARRKKREPAALSRVREQEVGQTQTPNSPLTSVALGTPVSSSDLYRRIFLDTPSPPQIPTKRVKPGEATSVIDDLNCSEHFVGDLSVILDEIMSNHRPDEDQGCKITNSTRIDFDSAAKQSDTDSKKSDSEAKKSNIVPKKPEDLEDTFDRMCY